MLKSGPDYQMLSQEDRAANGLRAWIHSRLRSLAALQRSSLLLGGVTLALAVAAVVIVSIVLSRSVKHDRESSSPWDDAASSDAAAAQAGAFSLNDARVANFTLYAADALRAATLALITEYNQTNAAWQTPPSSCTDAGTHNGTLAYNAAVQWANLAQLVSSASASRYIDLLGASLASNPACAYRYYNSSAPRPIAAHLFQITTLARQIAALSKLLADASASRALAQTQTSNAIGAASIYIDVERMRLCEGSSALPTVYSGATSYASATTAIQPWIVLPCTRFPSATAVPPVSRYIVYPGFNEDPYYY